MSEQERDALAAIIHAATCPYADCREDPMTWTEGEHVAADAIIAAGWRAPVVDTPAPPPETFNATYPQGS